MPARGLLDRQNDAHERHPGRDVFIFKKRGHTHPEKARQGQDRKEAGKIAIVLWKSARKYREHHIFLEMPLAEVTLQ